ncbi:hypothetical protein E2K93_17125 [Thalassotalea sp. HSM 43]|uniref:hypothetical protein n=1 Tax=Thalassotalea sp. HSM 43 TaxID=2552945 RepID=UPI0010817458|nr:hypothetical protein [Thalassotalea sp. HSM 43]QBY05980.1 hypothetical protein E2K93_17125 [Thalassotalea sp. HSM 43]
MNSRTLSTLEFYISGMLIVIAVALFINSYFCFFNKDSCGMVEPLVGTYILTLAIPLLIAGWLHRKQKKILAAMAYFPIVIVVLTSVGQVMQWW